MPGAISTSWIGDAILVRFQGDRAEARAIDAAREALRRLDMAGLPRGVGIGIYTGRSSWARSDLPSRMDFTVIGDSVNIAARLCGAAARGEILADQETVTAAGDTRFGPAETVSVKGRHNQLQVQRWQIGIGG